MWIRQPFCVAILVGSLSAPALATDYVRYVKEDGSDGSSGTNWAEAWRTLTHVRANVSLDAGDTLTLYLRAGDTIEGSYDSDNVSNDAVSVAIVGVNEDLTDAVGANRPIILGDAENTPTGSSGTTYGSHIVIGKTIDLAVENLQLIGQDFFATSGNVPMITGTRVDDALIDNCLLDGERGTTIDSPTHNYNAGIAFKYTTGAIEVRNSTIQYFGPPSLWSTPELPSGDDGEQGYLNTESICLFYGHTDRGSFAIHDNVIKNCNADGIQIENTRGTASAVIFNNTIANCGENTIDVKYTQNHTIYNNHLYRDPTFVGAAGIPYQANTDRHALLQLLVSGGDYYPTHSNVVRDNLLGPSDTTCLGLRSSGGLTNQVHDNDVYNNRFVGCRIVFLSEWSDRSNRIYNNVATEITETAVASDTGGDNLWENNTFIAASGSDGPLLSLALSHSTFRNNIFVTADGGNPICVHEWGTPTFAGNVWYNADAGDDVVIDSNTLGTFDEGEASGWNGVASVSGEIFADPEVDPGTGIPTHGAASGVDAAATPTMATDGLRVDSAWGHGAWMVPTVPRNLDAGPDVGAFELSGCIESWDCTDWQWGACVDNEESGTRTCVDSNGCGTELNKPAESQSRTCDLGGLVIWYPMDALDISGSIVLDRSGNEYHADLYGAVAATGQLAEALRFDGVDDYLDSGFARDLATWSVSVWVLADEAPKVGDDGIVMRQENFQLSWDQQGASYQGSANLKSGTWHEAKFGTLTASQWIHLAATYDGDALRAYKDGVLVTENPSPSGDPDPSLTTAKIGRHANDSIGPENFFGGVIDDVRIYGRVLDASEIAELATAATCGPGLEDCGGSCVNTDTDPGHCSGCDNLCPVAANASAVCVAGGCGVVCGAGWEDCNSDVGDGCEEFVDGGDCPGPCVGCDGGPGDSGAAGDAGSTGDPGDSGAAGDASSTGDPRSRSGASVGGCANCSGASAGSPVGVACWGFGFAGAGGVQPAWAVEPRAGSITPR